MQEPTFFHTDHLLALKVFLNTFFLVARYYGEDRN
jgi:hypothetical protein